MQKKIIKNAYPLSTLQVGMLFQALYEPDSDSYFMQNILKIEGKVNRDALEKAWQMVSNHHAILRTGFVWEKLDKPLQYVLERAEVPFEVEDWSDQTQETQEERLRECIEADRQRGFDLHQAPLFRIKLMTCSENDSYVLWSYHHILLDGWSTPLIMGDVLRAYESIVNGKEVALKHRAPYKNYIAWLQEQDEEKAREYWQETLRLVEEPTRLSFKNIIKDAVSGKDYETYGIQLSVEETEALQRFAGEQHVTLNTVLQGALGLLIQHYTQKTEVVMGVTISGRTIELPGIEEMVGLFINTLPLKVSCESEDTVESYLKRLQAQTQQLNEYTYTSLAQIHGWTGQHEGLFDVHFAFENYPDNEREKGENASLHVTNPENVVKSEYPLTVAVGPGRELFIRFSYQTDHFDREVIERMGEHMKTLLKSLQKKKGSPLTLPYLSEEEHRQLVRTWNLTEQPYPREKTISQLFEEQVEKTPENIAVVYEDTSLTYQELNERANQLAHYLRQRGVAPDTLVAIAVERSIEMVVGLLGILKAGGAYVPLDSSYPEDRLAFMLEDTKSSLLITQESLKEKFEGYKGKFVFIDTDWKEIEKTSKTNPPVLTLPHHLAYVIYTSGSTGKPKGVMIEHHNLVNYISYVNDLIFQINNGILPSKYALFSTFAADLGYTTIYGSLLSGKQFHLLNEETSTDSGLLSQYIKKHEIDFYKLTPSHFNALANDHDICGVLPKGFLMYGGEPLSKELILRVKENSSPNLKVLNHYGPTETTVGCCIYNEYGPTEATVGCCVYQVDEDNPRTGTVPIGRPIWNTQIYILDDRLEPVPVGVTGEIYIGGVGLARGYLGRPELTAERFIPSPFSEGARLYKTGDIARYLADGNIEFLGRCDDQVKVRGFRIELGEIETALSKHDDISQTVVVAREDESGAKKLVAYVVPGEFTPSPTELREYLENQLPEYMVPSYFVYLEEIPLTANGKTDRKALPAPDVTSRSSGDEYVAPRNEREEVLCEIWRSVLGIDQVGIKDHFFRIGGDSIVSIQLVSKARQKGIRFSVKDVFTHPTVEALASISEEKEDSGTLQAQQELVSGTVSLTPIQHLFFEQKLIKPHHFNQTVLLRPHKKLEPSLLEQALKDLVLHHDGLRHRYTEKAGSWFQDCVSPQEQKLVKEVDLSSLGGEELALEITRICDQEQGSFDLAEGPLVKAVLMDCGGDSQRLFMVIHHLVVDGVSWRILLEDLESLYEQRVRGETIQLPLKTHSYQQWASILQEYAKSESLQREEIYWQEIEEKIKPLPNDDTVMGKVLEANVKTLQVSLSREETRQLLQEVPRAYQTEINDSLLTALVLAIEEWTGESGVSFSLEGHGREEVVGGIDVSRTTGWFTSVFPVYLEVAGEGDIGDALKTVKETLRGIPQKGIGYGILRYLGSTRGTVTHPSLIFNYLGQWDQQQGQLWGPAQESTGMSVASENRSPHKIIVNAEVRDGQLQVYWLYDQDYASETIEAIGKSFITHLQQLIHHCCQDGVYGYTPSDFPLASLTQKVLDQNFSKKALLQDIYPLSSLQAGMLFQALYEPDSDSYFIQSILKIEGKVNRGALEKAWQMVSDHHAILRTGFVWEKLDKPLQYVLERAEVPFEVEDWSDQTQETQEERLRECIEADRQRGFDLHQAPLFRIKLMTCSENVSYMLWSAHHILSDGWSTPLIMGDVLRAYESIVNGKEVALKHRAPYKNYIAWLQEQDEEKAREYWQETLRLVEEPTRLSFKNIIKDAVSGKDYETYGIQLSVEETEALQRFAGEQHVTLNTVLQGALGLLIQHYTQKTEVVMGVTISGRTIELPGIEEMVGLFINTLPLKVSCESEDTVESYLKRLQAQTQQLNEYTYTSLAQIYGWTGQHEGLFDVLFVFENYPVEDMAREGTNSLKIADITAVDRIEYPLAILVGPGRELFIRFSYQTDHFDREVIERMGEHMKTLLKSLQKKKGSPLTLPYLSKEEHRQLVRTWNLTEQPYPREKTISQLFEEQVEKTPENIAVVYEDTSLTYQELNERANQLAHYLRQRGVAPDTLVAIAVERSIEMVVGLLGILKAGGAYVPLDSSYPEDRLAFMLEDTKSSLLITQESLKEKFEGYKGKFVFIDTDWKEIEKTSKTNPPVLTLPHHLAYVIYTSGSTGKPKGVMIEQKSLINFLLNIINKMNINEITKLLSVTTLAFDIAGLELYSPLLNGGCCILLSKEDTLDPNKLANDIIHHDANIMQATPTAWKLLVDSNWKGNEKLKALCGGESINEHLLHQLVKKCGNVWNLYGPTETTIWSSFHHYSQNQEQPISCVSIGKPMWNTEIYILDSFLNPVSVGISGEIYIGGLGLARGYLNSPDLTAEKFVPNPFVNDEDLTQKGSIGSPSLRLYRTGDIARYLPDGNIEFMGRIDDQVKIRGFRIELGEIESTLCSHAEVTQAVVVAKEDGLGHKKLIAYVVPHQTKSETSTTEGISRWKSVYNDVYKEIEKAKDITFNTVGWNSSYTGEPISEVDMAEWVENTINQILSLSPKRVLEIGCGAGLLLSRIAPHCQAYWGTDFSERAIDHLNALREEMPALKNVKLFQREADNFEGIEEGYFDVIVINSVIQYFPNLDYLKNVIKEATRSLRKGGIIFIGDVRSFSLLKAYASSVEYFRASEDEAMAQIDKNINQRVKQEKELVIDPLFFATLQEELKEISHIKVQPKRGESSNELTKFRYDVLLFVRNEAETQQIKWLNWKNAEHSLFQIQEHLIKNQPTSYGLQAVKNSRLHRENELLNWIEKANDMTSLKVFNSAFESINMEGINPQEFWKLGDRLGYKVEINWLNTNKCGAYDVAFLKKQPDNVNTFVNFPQNFLKSELASYANSPSQKIENIERSLHLKDYLKGSLPDYMIPSSIIYMEQFPLTLNGKIDRKSLPAPDSSSRSLGPEYIPPRNKREKELCEIWSIVLGVEKIGIKDHFFHIGGDSIISIQLVSKARQKGIMFSVRDVFTHPTVEALASLSNQKETFLTPLPQQDIVSGEVPLTPIQHLFFNQRFVEPHHFNQTVLLQTNNILDVAVLTRALNHLVLHHDSLRLRYEQKKGSWYQEYVVPQDQMILRQVDLSCYKGENLATRITSLCNEIQRSFNLAEGPLIKAALINCGENSQRLFIVLHHLIGDGVSWRILLEDLERFYKQEAHGEKVDFPAKTHSYQQWSSILHEYVKTESLQNEQSYWLEIEEKIKPLQSDIIDSEKTAEVKIHTVQAWLSKEETLKLLKEVPRVFQTEINDSLLTALAFAIEEWTGDRGMSLYLQGHGREEVVPGIDVSRTVGWFISVFPVYLEIPKTGDVGEALKAVKKTLRGIPQKGIGYGILRYLGETKGDIKFPSLIFNYLGQWDQQRGELWHIAGDDTGASVSSVNRSPHKIIVNAEVREGQLQVRFGYDTEYYTHQTIEGICQNFIIHLQHIINYCHYYVGNDNFSNKVENELGGYM